MIRQPLLVVALCAFALAAPSRAQPSAPAQPSGGQIASPQPKCPDEAAPIPAELQPWSVRTALTAATRPEELAKAELKVGATATAALAHTPEVNYPARPTKPGGSVAYGGLFRIVIAEAGTYRVAIGNAAWIDVVKGGDKAESVRHGGGPACSGIRKMVDYALQPGDYVVQISASADAQTGVLVAKLP